MRIAIISDIHGNAIALEALLDDVQHAAVDSIVCLGDAIQGGAQPTQVLARLRALGCPLVMGNADHMLLTGSVQPDAEPLNERQLAVRAWQLTQLTAADLSFIEGFQPTVTLALENNRSLLCFHGSPQSFDDIILPHTPDADVQRMMGAFHADVLTGGHTHLQQIRRLGDALFFNPGSVGFAYSPQQAKDEHFRADPWLEYAILTAAQGLVNLEFRRVPFDVDAWVHAIHNSGKPDADWQAAMYGRRLA